MFGHIRAGLPNDHRIGTTGPLPYLLVGAPRHIPHHLQVDRQVEESLLCFLRPESECRVPRGHYVIAAETRHRIVFPCERRLIRDRQIEWAVKGVGSDRIPIGVRDRAPRFFEIRWRQDKSRRECGDRTAGIVGDR